MKVKCTLAGALGGRAPEWPEGWPLPQVGDEVTVPGSDYYLVHVRTVWYPEGDPEDDQPEPFVYVVLGLQQ